ncbi:hypothetical protein RB619_17385 [Flavobacterium sp. LHD-80]|uniref:hypothetical protein n=1 Tax=Flavobacterium sp. LHD-80 TaxID=3071411 RepID=UPI0027DEDF37|nr:hypothetical protein [Flavobacterium sp. LHD-80]MDQ6472420.1 hypothetical protein [Flavobacterium sp. LHD-80]
MKKLQAFIFIILLTSCQVTETININPDGSGNIEVYNLQDENSMVQIGRRNFSAERFVDTTFVFRDYIKKYQETFVKFLKVDQAIFQEHANVKMQIKVDPIQVEHFNIVSSDFKKIEEVPNLYESLRLANSLKENFPIARRAYKINYRFDGTTFQRKVVIVDQEKFEEDKKMVDQRKKWYAKYKVIQSYTLHYIFPRKIKSVSNEKAILSEDKKSLTLEFQISDCYQNFESTDLEVVLEQKDFQ